MIMTTQEIKDLIASKIAGQGSAVDAGSALPQILNAIVDAIPEPTPTYKPYLTIRKGMSALVGDWETPENMASLMGVSVDDLVALMAGYIPNLVAAGEFFSVVYDSTYSDIRIIGFFYAPNIVTDGTMLPSSYLFEWDSINNLYRWREF